MNQSAGSRLASHWLAHNRRQRYQTFERKQRRIPWVQREFDINPVPYKIMAARQPPKVYIKPNGAHSSQIAVKVEYQEGLGKHVISRNIVDTEGIHVEELDEQDPRYVGRHSIESKFQALYYTEEREVHDRIWFYVARNPLPSGTDVVWSVHQLVQNEESSPKRALPVTFRLSQEQKADNEKRKKASKELHKKQKEKRTKTLEIRYQQARDGQQDVKAQARVRRHDAEARAKQLKT